MSNLTRIIVFLFIIISLQDCIQTSSQPDNNVKIRTRDGVILSGKFVPPKIRKKFTFIMIHGLGSNKSEWIKFAEIISNKGYGYFIYDLRGHGESNRDTKNREIDYRYFITPGPGSEWNLMVDDLSYVIKYLVHKNINKNRIGIIGASLGANIALMYASRHKFIPVVILLSPGWNYAGLNIESAVKEYSGRSIAIAVSPGDKYSYESSVSIHEILKRNNNKTEFFIGTGANHGVQMFDGKFEYEIINWIENQINGLENGKKI